MLGSRRNRCRHGAKECVFGCCRDRDKKGVRRVIRTREKRQFRQEMEEAEQ